MPYSDGSLRPWILRRIQTRLDVALPIQIVDVGAGAGLNREYLGPYLPTSHWTAIEVWEPYIERFSLPLYYDTVIRADAREIDLPPADLYIFGDVLEHMPKEDALELWERARKVSRFVAASLPIVHYPQGAVDGNPYEEHVHHYSVHEFVIDFPGITDSAYGEVVGSFWAQGL